MPVASPLSVRTMSAQDLGRCASLLTRAFANDAPSRWIWPRDDQFFEAFPRFVRAFGGAAFDAGQAHCVDAFLGAALWLPPGFSADENALGQLFEDTVDDALKPTTFSLFEQMDSFHPQEPHWHLPLIGVDPESQGRGIGSALLAHALEACDRAGLPAYLEATCPRNVALYARHGFERIGTIQAGDSPEIVPMLRKAR